MPQPPAPEQNEEKEIPASSKAWRLRYEKRSFLTLACAFILPSFIYGFQFFPLNQGHGALNNFLILLTLFAHPLAVLMNTFTSWGYPLSLSISATLQIAFLFFLHRHRKFTPRTALALAITVGMLDLLGLKLLSLS